MVRMVLRAAAFSMSFSSRSSSKPLLVCTKLRARARTRGRACVFARAGGLSCFTQRSLWACLRMCVRARAFMLHAAKCVGVVVYVCARTGVRASRSEPQGPAVWSRFTSP